MSLQIEAPVKADLVLIKGARMARAWIWKDADTDEVVPLTGYRATAQIRTEPGGELILDLDELIEVDHAAGRVSLDIGRTKTLPLEVGSYVWDLFLIDTDDPDDAVLFLSGKV